MDKLNTLKHGIQVLQNIKREKMMKIKKDIQNLCEEITGSSILCDEFTKVDPTTDLFIKRFEEFQSLLDELEHDKSCRAQKVSELLTTVRDLCNVLGMDFCSIAAEVHQSLIGSTSVHSISTSTLNKLANKVLILKEEKKRRLRMVVCYQ
jgi:protein regulator of cytokinesis 1